MDWGWAYETRSKSKCINGVAGLREHLRSDVTVAIWFIGGTEHERMKHAYKYPQESHIHCTFDTLGLLMKQLTLFVVGVLLLASCNINKQFMFRTPEDFAFDIPAIDSTSSDYRIRGNELISFDLYTADGAKVLEPTTSDETNRMVREIGRAHV